MYQMLLADMNQLVHLPWWFRTTWILVPLFARTESLLTQQSTIPSFWKYLCCLKSDFTVQVWGLWWGLPWAHWAGRRGTFHTELGEEEHFMLLCFDRYHGGNSSVVLSPSPWHMQVNAMLCVEQCHQLLSPLLWPRSINFFNSSVWLLF